MLLFVYGTLMRGEKSHELLEGALFIVKARTPPRFELVNMGWYPALVDGGSSAVHGEIYDVPDALITKLDEYEDAPDLYRREALAIGPRTVQAYLLREEHAEGRPRIASGDWKQR